MDSTPLSIDQLNGSSSLGTVSVKAIFNADKRAPLASLSSFKISSLEYAESQLQHTANEDSVFLKSSGCDTDDDMQDLSSDSEEVSFHTGSHRTNKKDKQSSHKLLKQTEKSPRVALLQRQRSISATSSDRVLLLEQQLLQHSSKTLKPRGILLQQHSDPKSLPTEEDTCSTLNTELCGTNDMTVVAGGAESSNTTLTQNSSLNTVLSFGKLSATPEAPADLCASTLSDSIMHNRYASICMPNALKDVILRGGTVPKNRSHSSTNLLDTSEVRLELPLIKSSEVICSSGESDERKSCNASLPSSSRKWSKETLF